MCGIAGVIYRNRTAAQRIGRDMTSMLQSMKHRGPDSTGFALYRAPTEELVVRIKLADSTEPREIEFDDDVRAAAARGRVAPARSGRQGPQHGDAQRVHVHGDARVRR